MLVISVSRSVKALRSAGCGEGNDGEVGNVRPI